MRNQFVAVGILAGSLMAAPAFAQHKAPNQQPATATAPAAPTGELPAGTYQVRLTAQEAKPDAVGASKNVERWVEFLQKGTVKGREVVSIVPQAEVKTVVKDAPPAPGTSKVQMLRGDEYVRVWINKAGNLYLIHMPTGAGSKA
jgi:hypothetical protein